MASASLSPSLFCVCRNAGLEVKALERRVISSVVLEAEDHDTPSNQVYYVLKANPRFGLLQLKVRSCNISEEKFFF